MPNVHGMLKWSLLTLGSILGAQDYLQPASSNLWVHGMLNESIPIPPFYSNTFKRNADALLETKGLTQDNITPEMITDVYLFLITNIQ